MFLASRTERFRSAAFRTANPSAKLSGPLHLKPRLDQQILCGRRDGSLLIRLPTSMQPPIKINPSTRAPAWLGLLFWILPHGQARGALHGRNLQIHAPNQHRAVIFEAALLDQLGGNLMNSSAVAPEGR
jgi:hypothetical protein